MQPVIGRGEPDPGPSVVRMLFHGTAEALLGETEIVAAEIFLAELHVVIGIVADQARMRQRRHRLATRSRFGRLHLHGAGRVAAVDRGCLVFFRRPQIAEDTGDATVPGRRARCFVVEFRRGRAGAQAHQARRPDDQDPRHSDTHHALRTTTRPDSPAPRADWTVPPMGGQHRTSQARRRSLRKSSRRALPRSGGATALTRCRSPCAR